jgi:hypothetical protein
LESSYIVVDFFDDLYQGTRPAKNAKPLDEDTKIK